MFWAMLVVSPILDAKGHYLGAVAMVADISARKRVEEDLSKANDRFLKAFYAGPCMSSIADLETGELIDVNDVWLDTFGLRREQAVGKTRDQLGIVLETSVTDAFRKITDGAAGRLEFESSFTAKDGQTVHTLATTEHVELDGRQAALTVSVDITARKQAEQELRAANDQFLRTFRASPGMGSIADIETGELVDVNDVWLDVMGVTRAEVVGKTRQELGLGTSQGARDVRDSLRSGTRENFETAIRTRHGQSIDVVASMQRLDLDGRAVVLSVSIDISERKKIEAELRKANERFVKAFNASPGMSTITDIATGEIIEANDIWLSVLGLSRADVIGKSRRELGLEFTSTGMDVRHELAVRETDKTEVESTICSTDDVQMTVITRLERIELDGRAVALSNSVDITERKRTEDELRTANDRFLKIFYASPAMASITDLETRWIVDVNDAWLDVTGLDRETAIGKTRQEIGLVLSRDFDFFDDASDNAQRRSNIETVIRAVDGTEVSLISNSERIELDRRSAVLSVSIDITERKRAEKYLLENERRTSEGQRMAHLGTWERNLDDGQIVWSDEIWRILDLDPGSIEPTPEFFFDVVHPDDLAGLINMIEAAYEQPRASEYRIIRPNGEIRYIDSRREVHTDETGRPQTMIGTLLDVTDRKVAENALASSLREKETLLREVHHRVKNNLQIIASLLRFQSKKARNPDDVAVFREGQDRLKSMILVHEKLYGSADLSNIDFGDYVRTLVEQLFQSYDEQADKVLVSVDADHVMLPIEIALPCGMIISELLTNVFKYAFPEAKAGTATVSIKHREERIFVAVTDTGIGMPAEIDIDDPNTFGLQLVRNLAEQIGGTLGLVAESGTAVTIGFPSRKQHRVKRAMEQARIFVVEDEALIAMAIKDQLEQFGYAVCGTAARGESALGLIADREPDLVLMDINLACKMNGIEVAEKLHQSGDVPVVFLTAYSDSELLARAAITEPFGYLIKPFEERELHVTIEMALYKHSMEQKLLQSQRMEAVGQLTGGVAHDFNNLLAVILGNLDLVLMDDAIPAKSRNLIDRAIGAVDRGADLTQRLLAFARKQVLDPQHTDVNTVIENTATILERALDQSIDLQLELQGDLPNCLIDQGQLENAIINLAINARDAMPLGGRLTIATSQDDLSEQDASLDDGLAAGKYVVVRVIDTGEGMSDDVIAHVFEPFLPPRESARGPGLGSAWSTALPSSPAAASELAAGSIWERRSN